MKQLFIISMALLAGLNAQAQLKEVKVTQEGYPNEHKLRVAFGSKISEVIPEGALVFNKSMEVDGPVYGMVINPNGMYAGFWIEPNATEIIVHKEGFPESIEVKGSESHTLYKSLRFAKDNEAFVKAFAKAPNNPVSLKHLNEFFRFMEMETGQMRYLYEMVSDENKPKMVDMKAYIDTRGIPKVTIDRDIYDFIGTDAEGNSFSTKDYRGKYLLLDFAATGCGPCWTGYPELQAETAKYENLQVLTFNQDHEKELWQQIADKKEIDLPWPVLWEGEDKKEVFEIYGIEGWPNFFLISPEGKVLDTWMGSGNPHMPETLKKLVK